jgi:integrase
VRARRADVHGSRASAQPHNAGDCDRFIPRPRQGGEAVTVRKQGDRWVVRWRDGGRGSRAHQKSFTREQDARRFDTAIRRAKDLGQLASEVVGSEQTVATFLEEWWEKYALATLKPSTLASHAYVLDRWIVPYLGRIRLRDITRETIDDYRAQLRAAGAGTPTINRALAILQGVLRRAVEWRRLPSNPVAGVVRIAHVRDSSIDARTPEQVEAIRAAILEQPDVAQFRRGDAALVSVLAYEGLRPGEAFALQWGDVLERGRSRDRLRIVRGLSERAVTTPKSARPRSPELSGLLLPSSPSCTSPWVDRASTRSCSGTRRAVTCADRTGVSACGYRRSRPPASPTSARTISATPARRC